MKKQEKIIDDTLEYIKDIFKYDNGGHDYYHSLRVFKVGTIIAKKERADLFVVQMACLLHDVDDYKLFGGDIGGISKAQNWLVKQSVPTEKIEHICSIIKNMSYKGIDTKMGKTLEEKIVQDADRLDAMGAIGIARAFTVGATINSSIYNPDIKPRININKDEYVKMNKEKETTTINHFYEKLLKLKDYINTSTGREIAEKRHKYMEIFLETFLNEWDGKC